jgi:Ni/Fe-hydrogenase subunit HybB-like protein
MSKTWQRAVPVFDVPIWTGPFKFFCSMGALGLILAAYREIVGLGPTSGMNDAYAWGIWKTFNTLVLTALGSGGFAIGIAAWLFRREKLHPVMRTALLTSFLAYLFGLIMLGVDVGRPWNFYWILAPWRWNYHSPLLEVAVCMTIYATIPLFIENIPPACEWFYYNRRDLWPTAEKIEKFIASGYPWIVSLAYVLPAMHQSSLGALMLLGGSRVHPLWQTPFLPLLYVWAAAFIGIAFVSVTLFLANLAWNRALDADVLDEMNRITFWLLASWLAFRLIDLTVRGQIATAFRFDIFAALFWIEIVLLGSGLWILQQAKVTRGPRTTFNAQLFILVGGMLYRFNPTTPVFQAKAGAIYFPSLIELLISFGFVSIGIAVFMFLAKVLAILPAPVSSWYAMEKQQSNTTRARKVAAGTAAGFATGD